MSIPTPDHLRREVLRLDLHDLSAPEIAAHTGVNRSTVEYIIRRTRGPHESAHRGNIKLVHDPLDILSVGARFNSNDLRGMIRFSDLADGTMFEVMRRDGSVYRAEIQSGELITE